MHTGPPSQKGPRRQKEEKEGAPPQRAHRREEESCQEGKRPFQRLRYRVQRPDYRPDRHRTDRGGRVTGRAMVYWGAS